MKLLLIDAPASAVESIARPIFCERLARLSKAVSLEAALEMLDQRAYDAVVLFASLPDSRAAAAAASIRARADGAALILAAPHSDAALEHCSPMPDADFLLDTLDDDAASILATSTGETSASETAKAATAA